MYLFYKHHHDHKHKSLLHTLHFCFFLMLISSLIFLASCGQQMPGTASNTIPAQATSTAFTKRTAVPGKPVALQAIHMFDARMGWAVADNTNRILHTTAGVTRWQDVSPPFDTSTPILAGTDFFNPWTAWVAVTEGTRLFVYHTRDGGQTWKKTQLPDQCIGNCQIDFITTQVGWMLVGKGAAAGSEAVDVLHTSDGGATWKVISVSSYNTLNNPTALPFGGDKSGISFVNATTGWVTGYSPVSQFAWLYITHDGGVIWQHQSIPLPADAFGVSILPPVFFNATDGILPVDLSGTQSDVFNIYVTHNGGASWSSTTPVSTPAIAGLIDFIDAAHGWLAGNTYAVASNQYDNSTVYRTSDGGQHWMQYIVKLNAAIAMIDFVSQAEGWAIDSTQALYQTIDGGQTWTKVTPTGNVHYWHEN